MIAELIKTFNNIGLKLTSEEIADILWLADHLEKPEATPVQDRQKTDADTSPRDKRMPDFPQKQDDQSRLPDKKKEPETEMHPSGSGEKSAQSEIGGTPIRSPGGSALPGELSISRALRPLMRKVPSRSRFVLDEGATVQRIADEDNWAPVYVPALSRWLDVVLVVDEWVSMAVWQQTIAELKQLLERQAAFRDVQVWGFRTDKGNDPVLHVGTGFQAWDHPARSPRELIDPLRWAFHAHPTFVCKQGFLADRHTPSRSSAKISFQHSGVVGISTRIVYKQGLRDRRIILA